MQSKNNTTQYNADETYSLPSGGLGLLHTRGGDVTTVGALGVSGFGHGEIEVLTTDKEAMGYSVAGRWRLVFVSNGR
jgi:hypothetical protein